MLRSLVVALALFALPAHAENLVCFGDSQTAEMGLDPSETWCWRLATLTGRGYVNRGVPGNTTADLLERLQWDVLDDPAPACVAIMIGTNDGKLKGGHYDFTAPWTGPYPAKLAPGETQANLTAIIEAIKEKGDEVTVITSWARGDRPNLNQQPFYNDAVKAAAVATGTPLLDAYEIVIRRLFVSSRWNGGNGFDLFSLYRDGDWVHPSAQGHAEIAALCDRPQNQTACACRRAN